MVDDSASSSSATDTAKIDSIKSSSGTPTQVYRSWASANASRPSVKDEHRLKLFESLEKFVRASGGFITTPPNEKRIRIECPLDSDLEARLAHYHPILVGQSMRTSYAGFQQMAVLEISLEP